MTKKDLITETQKMEAKFWLELKQAEFKYGAKDPITNSLRARWVVMDQLFDVLGLSSDPTLPDNKDATALVMARIEKQKDLVELIKY
jgi:hypothetical protein